MFEIFTPQIGEGDSHFDSYFSSGLVQPPTCKVDPKNQLFSIERVWNPFFHGRKPMGVSWGYFTLLIGVITPVTTGSVRPLCR